MVMCNDPPAHHYNKPIYCNCTQGSEKTIDDENFDKMMRWYALSWECTYLKIVFRCVPHDCLCRDGIIRNITTQLQSFIVNGPEWTINERQERQ